MNITIPPEALEAAARAAHDQWRHECAVEADEPVENWREWDELDRWEQDSFREQARAACLAMLEAWQTEKHKMIVGVAIDEVGGQCPAIILPLPQKETSE